MVLCGDNSWKKCEFVSILVKDCHGYQVIRAKQKYDCDNG